MTITNGYCTLAQLRAELTNYEASDTSDDTRLEACVEAASRQIDRFCGQRFWQDGSVATREFYPADYYCVRVDEDEALATGISTTTGLVVKTDDNDDGTFETTWTINTDFLLQPVNAADHVPVQPYTRIVWIRNGGNATGFMQLMSGRPHVQVVAKFGWPAVPDDVEKACIIQATQLFKASDAAFGIVQDAAGYSARMRASLNPMAEALLEGYVKPRVG